MDTLAHRYHIAMPQETIFRHFEDTDENLAMLIGYSKRQVKVQYFLKITDFLAKV